MQSHEHVCNVILIVPQVNEDIDQQPQGWREIWKGRHENEAMARLTIT